MPGGERTEEATPKRRGEARGRGQVLKSIEVNTAVILVGGLAFLQWTLPGMARSLVELTQHVLESASSEDLGPATLQAKTIGLGLLMAKLLGPLLFGLVVLGVLANVGQFGFLLSTQTIKPHFSKINPLEGAKRFFSSRSLVELFKALAKVAVIGGFAYQALQDKGALLVSLADMEPAAAAGAVTAMMFSVLWKVAMAFVVLAAVDYWYQRWFFKRNMRMSKEEIKEELKQSEGDPRVRARLRQRARALSRQRMMQQVPKADVVVTNPTHFAVALKYEAGMDSPLVIAKGERLIAQQIKKIAREHGVPTVENKPLAQALYKACQVGQMVPPELFKAVAEVLAFVYRLHPHRAPAGFAGAAAASAAA